MKRLIAMCLVLSACGVDVPSASDDASDIITCTEGCGGGGGSGGGGGGGGGATAAQLCEAEARDTCASLGFAGNFYCYLVFAQTCSPTDQANAIAYCLLNPGIRHDANCHPQW